MTKTFRELKISEREFTALQNVRNKLASGQFVHVPDNDAVYEAGGWRNWLRPGRKVFNMGQCFITGSKGEPRKSCGQVGCIGGWMGIEMGMDEYDAAAYVERAESREHPFHHLFYPFEYKMGELNDKMAVGAIDAFLDGNKRPWDAVRGAPRDLPEDD